MSEKTPQKRSEGKASAQAWNVLLGGIIVALVLVVNYLAYRHYTRWDWTSGKVFTLSSRTEEVLRGLDQPIDVYVFLSSMERTQQDVRELLTRYRAKSNKLTVRYVDPNTKPDEFRLLAQRFHLGGMQVDQENIVADVAAVVVAGDRRWKITSDDLTSIDLDSLGDGSDARGAEQLVKMEQAFTSALLQVTRGRPTTVCIAQGHGEWPLEGGGERSLVTFRDEMQRDNVTFRALSLLGGTQVPADCDALYVVGPSASFTETESAQIGSYLRGGGDVLLALDPRLEREHFEPSGLEALAREQGILIDSSIVIEMDDAHRLDQELVGRYLITDYGDHPTTAAFTRLQARTFVHFARSVRVAEGTSAKPVLRASSGSYAETSVAELSGESPPSKDDHDFAGPVSIGALVELPKPSGSTLPHGGRLIVIGTSSVFAPQALLQPAFINFDLLSAWTGWLTERPELVSIAPRRVSARPMTLTADDVFWLFFRLVVFMPAASMFIGLALWRARKS